MKEIKGLRLWVALGASKVRRRLKGHGFGVRKVYSDGKNRAMIIHTATGDHLRRLEALFQEAFRQGLRVFHDPLLVGSELGGSSLRKAAQFCTVAGVE